MCTTGPPYDPVRTGIAPAGDRQEGRGAASPGAPDNWIDKLTGSAQVRTMIDAGADADEVVAAWQDELAAFRRVRKEYLVYR